MNNSLDTTFKFRIQSELIREFNRACEDNDQTAAQVLRAAVREYVATNSKPQGELLSQKKVKTK